MKRGEWRVTSQGIGFDSFGRLRDAHHRLNACVKSGVAFRSVVVLGLREDAYEVIDIGMKRSYADRLGERRDVTDVLRLGCQYVLNCNSPTIDQMRPILEAGFRDAVEGLIEFCGTRRKFYASAPIKLAAVTQIMNGGDADYILQQYRALCNLNFDQMSTSSKSLVRQVESKKARSVETRETLARGLRLFDSTKQALSKIQVSEADKDSATTFVRNVLKSSVLEYNKKTNLFNLD